MNEANVGFAVGLQVKYAGHVAFFTTNISPPASNVSGEIPLNEWAASAVVVLSVNGSSGTFKDLMAASASTVS